MEIIHALPGWKTERLIGRGGFGSVYEIQRSVFGDIEKCALKHISIPQTDGEIREMKSEGLDEQSITQSFADQAKDIVAEYKMMAQLNDCPNVVTCHDVECIQKDDGYGWDIFIRMELLTPLMDILSERAESSEKEIINLGKDICSALVACRRLNIIHRDIKPQNIFVSQDGKYKLGDFGIARIAEKTSSATARIGTYTYMAPEVYNGERYSSVADIYSLGMVLYWLLNERRAPFVSINTARGKEDALRRRMNGEPILAPKNGAEKLKQIVLKATAFDPKDRYQNAEEMLREIEKLNASSQEIERAAIDCSEEAPSNEADSLIQNLASLFHRSPEETEEKTVSAFSEEKDSSVKEINTSSEMLFEDKTVGAFNSFRMHEIEESTQEHISNNRLVLVLVATLIVILDQWTKNWTSGNIAVNTGSRDLIPAFLKLVNVHYYGLGIITLIPTILVIIILFMRAIRTPEGQWSSLLVVSGWISNSIDRLLNHYVEKNTVFSFISRLPPFNLADALIVVFSLICIFSVLLQKHELKGKR